MEGFWNLSASGSARSSPKSVPFREGGFPIFFPSSSIPSNISQAYFSNWHFWLRSSVLPYSISKGSFPLPCISSSVRSRWPCMPQKTRKTSAETGWWVFFHSLWRSLSRWSCGYPLSSVPEMATTRFFTTRSWSPFWVWCEIRKKSSMPSVFRRWNLATVPERLWPV